MDGSGEDGAKLYQGFLLGMKFRLGSAVCVTLNYQARPGLSLLVTSGCQIRFTGFELQSRGIFTFFFSGLK